MVSGFCPTYMMKDQTEYHLNVEGANQDSLNVMYGMQNDAEQLLLDINGSQQEVISRFDNA